MVEETFFDEDGREWPAGAEWCDRCCGMGIANCADEIAAGDWTPGRWAWPVMEAELFDLPIPWKGAQGWWRSSLLRRRG